MSDIGWSRTSAETFWREIAPADHVLQLYQNEQVLIETLTAFAENGIRSGETVIVVATQAHHQLLREGLVRNGISVDQEVAINNYIPLDANDTLSLFMVNDWPNKKLFTKTVSALLKRGNKKHRRVRIFGEMVAILWKEGNRDATVQLEALWNEFCKKNNFCLFCAYPLDSLAADAGASVIHICDCHTKVIDGTREMAGEIEYAQVV